MYNELLITRNIRQHMNATSVAHAYNEHYFISVRVLYTIDSAYTFSLITCLDNLC